MTKHCIYAISFAAALFLALALSPPAKAQAAEAAPSCAPANGYAFICGLTNVEDIVQVPGTRWLIGSSMRLGQASVPGSGAALYLIDSDARTARAAPIAIEPDQDGPLKGCAPLDPTRPGTHGLELREGPQGWGGGVHTLYAVNHGGREAIEVFKLDARTPTPVITWTGCIPTPANAWANSVAALPDGALAISKYADLQGLTAGPVFRGEITGVVYIWKPGAGFSELAGSQLSGNNGLIASKDGKRLWVADQGRRQVVRFALDGSAPPAYAKLGFNPDNLRWAPGGSILAAGQIIAPDAALAGANAWGVARLNPDTLAVTPMLTEPGRPEFANGTVALQVGKTLWFGTFRGERLAYAPLK